MMRLLSIGIDCVSAAIFVIPALAILQCTIYRKWEFKPFCVKLIFAFYAIALFSVVGVPAVVTFQIDFGLNLIPFIDIVNSPFAYMKNTIEQNRCAMACQGCGAVLFLLKKQWNYFP